MLKASLVSILSVASVLSLSTAANALPRMGTNCPTRFAQICSPEFKPPAGSGTPRTSEGGATRKPGSPNPRKSAEKQIFSFEMVEPPAGNDAPSQTASGATKTGKKFDLKKCLADAKATYRGNLKKGMTEQAAAVILQRDEAWCRKLDRESRQ